MPRQPNRRRVYVSKIVRRGLSHLNLEWRRRSFFGFDFPENCWHYVAMSHGLTDYYKQIIQRQIHSGRFNNENEVVRHSLRVLDALERGAGPAGRSFGSAHELENMLLAGLESGPAR